jgi:hypothetical protein
MDIKFGDIYRYQERGTRMVLMSIGPDPDYPQSHKCIVLVSAALYQVGTVASWPLRDYNWVKVDDADHP